MYGIMPSVFSENAILVAAAHAGTLFSLKGNLLVWGSGFLIPFETLANS